MGRKKRSAEEYWGDAEANGLKPVAESDINGDIVRKGIEEGTDINYTRMTDRWDTYKIKYEGATLEAETGNDIEIEEAMIHGKRFIEGVGRNTKNKGEGTSMYYILQVWADLGAGLARRGTPVSSVVSESIYHHIRGPLRKLLGLSEERRPRHFVTLAHVIIITKHIWQKDWHIYKHPRMLVYGHTAALHFTFTSTRVGELFESGARKRSGRGLLYKDIVFIVFGNEKGKAELAVSTRRDAKGMTHTPHERPKHALYEDMTPLSANPFMPFFAISLADKAFRDYDTFEEIFMIPPPPDGVPYELQIRKELDEVPFFQTVTAEGPTGKIQTAGAHSKQMVDTGHRAGYGANLTFKGRRREALIQADSNGYSKSERMKFAGHTDPNVFFGSYMDNTSTVDGQASMTGGKPRTVHTDAFRGLSLQYDPQRLHSLPAKVEDDLSRRPDFIKIGEELAALGSRLQELGILGGDKEQEIRNRRRQLYLARCKLMSDELSQWRAIQPRKIALEGAKPEPSVGPRSNFFNRVRHLDPPRDRLASSLFEHVSLRSPQGRIALRDMITLCLENPQVAYRPSLHPANGCCPVPSCAQIMTNINPSNRWHHVYTCHKAHLSKRHGFAQLCFQCDKWITSKDRWREHCQHHLDRCESLPVQLNPLVFRKTIAAAGQCLFCLFDPELPPEKRFQQFPIKQSWQEHMSPHWETERKKSDAQGLYDKPAPCPDLRCALYFDSVKDLQYHSQDIHYIDRIEIDLAKRRHRPERDCYEAKRRCCSDDDSQNKFVNKTAETFISNTTNLTIQIQCKEEIRAVGNPRGVNSCTASTSASPSPTSEDSLSMLDWKLSVTEAKFQEQFGCAASTSASPSPTSEDSSSISDLELDTATSVTEGEFHEQFDSSDSDSLDDDEESYEVEQIIDHEVFCLDGKVKYKYKVRWAGYGPEDDEWKCPESFNGLEMIEEYHQLLQLPET